MKNGAQKLYLIIAFLVNLVFSKVSLHADVIFDSNFQSLTLSNKFSQMDRCFILNAKNQIIDSLEIKPSKIVLSPALRSLKKGTILKIKCNQNTEVFPLEGQNSPQYRMNMSFDNKNRVLSGFIQDITIKANQKWMIIIRSAKANQAWNQGEFFDKEGLEFKTLNREGQFVVPLKLISTHSLENIAVLALPETSTEAYKPVLLGAVSDVYGGSEDEYSNEQEALKNTPEKLEFAEVPEYHENEVKLLSAIEIASVHYRLQFAKNRQLRSLANSKNNEEHLNVPLSWLNTTFLTLNTGKHILAVPWNKLHLWKNFFSKNKQKQTCQTLNGSESIRFIFPETCKALYP